MTRPDALALLPHGETGDAVISADGRYRYRLDRDLRGDGPPFVVCMVNPSTADATVDDATIRRCIGFGRRAGASSLVVVNVFALRATDVRTLRTVVDPIGPENAGHLEAAARLCGRIVCAWGSRAKIHPDMRWRLDAAATAMRQWADLYALRVLPSGDPEHPLMLPNACEPALWKPVLPIGA